jgi:hypothetical protein
MSMTDWKSSLRSDPMPWLMDNACPAIRYRVLTELLELGRENLDVQKARQDLLLYEPALNLEKEQKPNGTWGNRIHAGETRKEHVSLEHALHRFLEYGWNRETTPIKNAAKVLRTFLTQKKDLNFFEFAKSVKSDQVQNKYYRWFLRIIALELLTRTGYDDDRSRMAIVELLELAAGFVDLPGSRNPTEEIGASHPLIRMEVWNRGYVFMPDYYIIRAFACSPWLLRGDMWKMRLKKIFDYILSPLYQNLAPGLGLIKTAKGSFLRGGGVKMRTLDEYQKTGHVDEMLMHLELFSSLGLVNRYPILMNQIDWVYSQQGKDGHWSLSTRLWNDNSRWTELQRVEKDWRSPARKVADMTFRVLLIMKNQWERQIIMLDRGDDGYPI